MSTTICPLWKNGTCALQLKFGLLPDLGVAEIGPKDESIHSLKEYFCNPMKKVMTRISPQENEKDSFDFVNILVLLTKLILS